MNNKAARTGIWSLSELYESFECECFQKDFESFKKEIERIKLWARENFSNHYSEKEVIEEYVRITNDLEKYSKLGSYASLTLVADTENRQAAKYLDIFKEAYSEMSGPDTLFEKYVCQCENLEDLINSSEILSEHRFYLREINQNGRFRLSEKEELLLAKMENTGSAAWGRMKEQLASTMFVDIEIDGEKKELPLSVVRNMAKDPSAAVRKNAYEAELKSYSKIEKPVAAALNAIKGEVLTVCNLRGYSSPLEMTVLNSRINMNILNAMLSAISEFLPVFVKYFKKKAEILGYDGGLPFYDLFAPIGSVNLTFTYEEAAEYIISNFNDFSEKLGTYARKAFDRNWIDAFPRKGKRGGASCSNLHFIKESRIISNFSGSYDDMLTLAHELGHGYHGACLVDATYINSGYPMPIAETASTFSETLVTKAALKTATKEEALTILEQRIGDAAQVIVDIYSRFLFEDELFKRRSGGSLSVDEFKEIMTDSQKKAYRDGLDENFLHPYMWICKPHYYYSHRNYYNFPYAYGLLFANGLYSMYTKDKNKFVSDYDTLLAATGKYNLTDVGNSIGINVEDKSFWVSSLEIISGEIDEFCSL